MDYKYYLMNDKLIRYDPKTESYCRITGHIIISNGHIRLEVTESNGYCLNDFDNTQRDEKTLLDELLSSEGVRCKLNGYMVPLKFALLSDEERVFYEVYAMYEGYTEPEIYCMRRAMGIFIEDYR